MSIRFELLTRVGALLVASFLLAPQVSIAQERASPVYVVGLPADSRADVVALKTTINRIALGLRPGAALSVANATTLQTIASVNVPDEPAYANQNILISRIAPALAQVRQFVDRYPASPQSAPIPSEVLLPEFLEHVAKNIAPKANDRDVRVLIIGSARYGARREPTFSMERGLWPGDGLIAASSRHSPFGTGDKRGLLDGVSVHYCIVEGPNDWPPAQREGAERAYSLYVGQLGGRLSTFSPDLISCAKRFVDSAPPVRTFGIDTADTALVMKGDERVAGSEIRKVVPPTSSAAAAPAPSSLFAQNKLETRAPEQFEGRWTIGASWHDQIDLDLHVRCDASLPFVNFKTTRTAEATFPYDYQRATGSAEETVDIIRPSDIRSCDAWINYYAGAVTAPKGIVRIRLNGAAKPKIWEWRFEFPSEARSGNRAAGFPPRGNMGPSWIRIPIDVVLRLRAAPLATRTGGGTR